jgi:methyl-accepting chemotaxis protein
VGDAIRDSKSKSKRENRKVLVVDKPLQYQIISLVVISGAVVCLISIFGLYLLFRQMMASLMLVEPDSPAIILMTEHYNNIVVVFVILVMISLVWSWLSALYLSNKIAGPAYNMSKSLDEYFQGNKEKRIKLRKKDFFIPLAEKINRVLDEK